MHKQNYSALGSQAQKITGTRAKLSASEKIRLFRLELDDVKPRSAWKRGVKEYACELWENATEWRTDAEKVELLESPNLFAKALLNGAEDWTQFSEGGCALIYDTEIAARLCNPTELKRTKCGRKAPNLVSTWLEVQARALCQAAQLLERCRREAVRVWNV